MKYQTPPTLMYNQEWDRYELRLPDSHNTECTYAMVIDHSWHGDKGADPDHHSNWYRYRFVSWTMGDWIEVVTFAQYNGRVQDIVEHESIEVADVWIQEQEQVVVVADDHPVFELQKYWEAMMELNLFRIPATMRTWASKPLSKETLAKMDAIGERQMREAVAEASE